MALTPQQLSALKADILADPVLAALPNNSDGNFAIADAYALQASPAFWVWRTSVTRSEYVSGTSVDATTFNWTGAGFITRAQGERDAFRELFNHTGTVNPSLANVRQAFVDIFSGTGVAAANRTHMATVSRRLANRAERLFATGTGSTGSPGLMTLEGSLHYSDIEAARNLP